MVYRESIFSFSFLLLRLLPLSPGTGTNRWGWIVAERFAVVARSVYVYSEDQSVGLVEYNLPVWKTEIVG